MSGNSSSGNSSSSGSSRKHWSSGISTALSNFVVQYNYGSMSCALLIMASSVCTYDDDITMYSDCDMKGQQREWVEPTSNSIVYLGSILGQLTLGFCGDYFGRTIALAIALLLTTIGAFFSAVAPPYNNDKAVSIYVVIIFFRFLMGVGVGAIFPLTATKSAEDAGDATGISTGETEHKQLNLIAASWGYFWQMPGILAPWVMMLLLNSNNNSSPSANWRAVLGMGSIPSGICTVLLMLEYLSSDNKADKLLASRSSSKNTWDEVITYLSHRSSQYKLIGASIPWFLFDFYIYGLGLVSGYILISINGNPRDSNVSSKANLILISYEEIILLLSTIPGTILSIVYLIPKTGYKKGQFYSFIIHSASLAIVASFFYLISEKSNMGLLAFYTLMSCFLQIGVQITTFSVPSASFPTHVRVTLNGLSCAIAKIGAVLGGSILYPIYLRSNWTVVIFICSLLAGCGAIVTHYFVDIEDSTLKNDDETNDNIRLSNIENTKTNTLNKL